MDKKYIAGVVALNKEQVGTLAKAQALLEKSLGSTLSRSQAIAILAHLYVIKDDKAHNG